MNHHEERRDRDDRRREEYGPPLGWKDRRRRTERRMPEIGECEVSEAEWLAYFGSGRPNAAINTLAVSDASAEVFSRIRD